MDAVDSDAVDAVNLDAVDSDAVDPHAVDSDAVDPHAVDPETDNFVRSWKWTHHPCWIWRAPCIQEHTFYTHALVRYVLIQGHMSTEGSSAIEVERGIQTGFHPNWIRCPGGTVEDVRTLLNRMSHKAFAPGWRVVTLEHPLNTQASNALLKMLEEPTPQTLWIIWATHLGQLLPTLRSRCQHIRLPVRPKEGSTHHPLAWGSSQWHTRMEQWGGLKELEALIDKEVDTHAIKNLWAHRHNVDPWYVIDTYVRLLYARTMQEVDACKVDRWWAVHRWVASAQLAHLDPTHTLAHALHVWQQGAPYHI